MVNRPAVAGCVAALWRPGLLLPDIAVRDIRSLNWRALHDAGVRAVVFDKDNCLTRPLQSRLVPELRESYADCRRTFGKGNVLIVSNSAGSALDPLGIRAADVSTSLDGTPVLLHQHKKPSRRCADQVIEYFQQQQALPGSILVIGDRPTTDIALAHRISDGLKRMRGAGEEQPRGIGVFTTGLWASEGRVNAFMRRIEVGVVRWLVKRRVSPGAGWARRRGVDIEMNGLLDDTSRGLVGAYAAHWQKIAVAGRPAPALPSSAADSEAFAFSGRAIPAEEENPTIPRLAFAALRARLPRFARVLQRIGGLRPVAWTLETAREGVQLIWLGFAHAIMQAGIWRRKGAEALPQALELEQASEELAAAKRSTAAGTRLRSPELPFFLSSERPTAARHRRDAGTARLLHCGMRRPHPQSSRPPPVHSPPPPPPPRAKMPLRNWIAAMAALAIMPIGYLFGAWLHEQKEFKDAEKEAAERERDAKLLAEKDRLERQALAQQLDAADAVTSAERRAQREYEEIRQNILTSRHHLSRDREELQDKLNAVRQRREKQAQAKGG